MAGNIPSERSAYIGTFQNFDGSNYTLAGYENKYKQEGKSISTFVGIGTNFNDNPDLVVDLKGSMNYDQNGIFNQNIRLRGKMKDESQSFQLRYSPLSVNIPVADGTSIYANPCYVGQISSGGNWKNSATVFAGATKTWKLNDGENTLKVSGEIQRYNLQNIKDNDGSNWGANVTISYSF